MAYGTTQIEALQGPVYTEQWPVAATQTLHCGDPVQLVAGVVTLAVAAGNNIDSTTGSSIGLLGIMAQESVLNATGTLVSVHPFTESVTLTLPTYTTGTTAPAKTNILSGALTSGFVLRFDTGSILKLNLDVTSNPVARIRNLEMTDARKPSDARLYKTTGVVADRVKVGILASVRQFTI